MTCFHTVLKMSQRHDNNNSWLYCNVISNIESQYKENNLEGKVTKKHELMEETEELDWSSFDTLGALKSE